MMGPIPDFPIGYRLPADVDLQIRATAALRREEMTARPAPVPAPRAHRLYWRRRPAAVPTLN